MVGSSQREFGHGTSIRRLDDSRGLGRDGGGNADRVQETSFDCQCFREWCSHAEQRLICVRDRSFGDSLDIAAEAKSAKPFQEACIIAIERSQELDLTGVKRKGRSEIERDGETGGKNVPASEGVAPSKKIERGAIEEPILPGNLHRIDVIPIDPEATVRDATVLVIRSAQDIVPSLVV